MGIWNLLAGRNRNHQSNSKNHQSAPPKRGQQDHLPLLEQLEPRLLLSTVTDLSVSQDAYVQSQYPASNQNSIVLGVKKDAYGNINNTFVKFNIGGIPNNSDVQNAYIKLYGNAYDLDGSGLWIGAQRVTGSWSESSITWNNQPGVSSSSAPSTWINNQNNVAWMNMDVTSLVEDWIEDGDSNYGIRLATNTTQGSLSAWSSEYSGTTYDPVLVVEYIEGAKPDLKFAGLVEDGNIDSYVEGQSHWFNVEVYNNGAGDADEERHREAMERPRGVVQ